MSITAHEVFVSFPWERFFPRANLTLFDRMYVQVTQAFAPSIEAHEDVNIEVPLGMEAHALALRILSLVDGGDIATAMQKREIEATLFRCVLDPETQVRYKVVLGSASANYSPPPVVPVGVTAAAVGMGATTSVVTGVIISAMVGFVTLLIVKRWRSRARRRRNEYTLRQDEQEIPRSVAAQKSPVIDTEVGVVVGEHQEKGVTGSERGREPRHAGSLRFGGSGKEGNIGRSRGILGQNDFSSRKHVIAPPSSTEGALVASHSSIDLAPAGQKQLPRHAAILLPRASQSPAGLNGGSSESRDDSGILPDSDGSQFYRSLQALKDLGVAGHPQLAPGVVARYGRPPPSVNVGSGGSRGSGDVSPEVIGSTHISRFKSALQALKDFSDAGQAIPTPDRESSIRIPATGKGNGSPAGGALSVFTQVCRSVQALKDLGDTGQVILTSVTPTPHRQRESSSRTPTNGKGSGSPAGGDLSVLTEFRHSVQALRDMGLQ